MNYLQLCIRVFELNVIESRLKNMAETKLFTLAEVAKHKTNNDVWLVIHNSVYDVTAFLNEVNRLFIVCNVILS